MGRKSKYTEYQLREAVKTSISMREVSRKLGKNPDSGSGNYLLKLKIKSLEIDTSHFKGQGWCTGDLHKKQIEAFVKIPLSKILIKNSTYLNTDNLKKRLIKENLIENKCKICGQLPYWYNKPLVLQLDHIDGDRTNNNLENLRILCPNCHTQTPTFSSKRRKKKCIDCKCNISSGKAKRCLNCANKQTGKNYPKPTKIQWPSTEQLKQMVVESNYLQVAKKLGVSDNAVRKRIKNHSE